MQTIKHPYEILIRGNHENHVVAAHVVYAVTIVHDDGSIQVVPGQPEPCLPDNLADVLDPLIAEPLTQIQSIRDEVSGKIKELELSLQKESKDFESFRNESAVSLQIKNNEITSLKEKLISLQVELTEERSK